MVVVVVLTLVNIKLTAKITAASTTTTTVLRLEVLNWNLNKSYKTDLNIQNFPKLSNPQIYKYFQNLIFLRPLSKGYFVVNKSSFVNILLRFHLDFKDCFYKK